MTLIATLTALLTLASALAALLVRLVYRLRHRRPTRYWTRWGQAHLLLVPLYAFVVVPALFGLLGARFVGTRGDESGYAGPRIDPSTGEWIRQTRDTLREEKAGRSAVPDEVRSAAASCAVALRARDGVALRGFVVPPRGRPRFAALLVHGLFRGSLEIETVGRWLRDEGAAVLLLEMRCHGGSEKTTFTFGAQESLDVLAGYEYLRAQASTRELPVLLFGVSLGSAAAALAAAQIPDLGALVLDAPMLRLVDVAHRVLLPGRPAGDGRQVRFLQPWRSLILTAIEMWSGTPMDRVDLSDVYPRLPADLPALIVGAGDDQRMPPEVVRAVFASLRSPADKKELWICEGARHGQVWEKEPEEYRRRLSALVMRMLAARDLPPFRR